MATAAEHVEKFFTYTIFAFSSHETGQNERSATKNFAARFSSWKYFKGWIDPFHSTGLFLYPLKTAENSFRMFSGGTE